jgi:2-dehydro-3-deoxyphosphogalactonate aldolase
LVAILRGVADTAILEVARVVLDAGLRVIEVPLNSPNAFASIRQLADAYGHECLCGAGTVIEVGDVQRVYDAGGRLIVAPNVDQSVIAAALQLNMLVMPGVATATEAFTAVKAGATQLKLFPASTYGPNHLRALRAVLPQHIRLYPVGGVAPGDLPAWKQAGAAGFGFGSELFSPRYGIEEIAQRAHAIVSSFLSEQ